MRASLGANAVKVALDRRAGDARSRAARAAKSTQVIVIDTDPIASTEAGGAWWDVAVPEISPRAEVATRAQGIREGAGDPALGDSSMTIRLGVNPIGWSNDDLQDIGGDIPLETCLAEAREAGFDGMEKGHKLPDDGAALKAKLAEFGLVFVGGWYSTELLTRSAQGGVRSGEGAHRDDQGRRRDVLVAAEMLQHHPRRSRRCRCRSGPC